LAVIPAMLAPTGMDREAIFLATCFTTAVSTIIMGLYVNMPIALAPGMGLGAYFATLVTKQGGISWEIALGAVFISGIIYLLLAVFKIQNILLDAIPKSLKHAITVGIGLFIALIGLKISHLTILNLNLGPSLLSIITGKGIGSLKYFVWNTAIGQFNEPTILLALIGLFITVVLVAINARGAIFIGLVLTTIIGIPLGVTDIHHISFALPSPKHIYIGALNIKGALNATVISAIFTFTFIGLMDSFGCLVSTASRAKLLDTEGKSPLIGKGMLVNSIGISLGALLGVSSVTAYIESAAGVSVGGRTGLTAIVVGILFLLAILLSPIFQIIPNAAIAPALIIVGTFMISSVKEINFEDFTEGLPAFLTIVLMPFTYNIANGISAGIFFYTALKLITGKPKEIHWMMYALTVLVIIRYMFFA
jgi:adenine/guanine/hypoxanthine permease